MELPAEVVAEIEANRKVTAVKMLREQQGIGLKEAKQIVDAYSAQQAAGNPGGTSHKVPETDTGIGRIVILIIGVSIIYAIYRYFS